MVTELANLGGHFLCLLCVCRQPDVVSECLKPAIVTKYLETWNSTLWLSYNVHVSVKKLLLYP